MQMGGLILSAAAIFAICSSLLQLRSSWLRSDEEVNDLRTVLRGIDEYDSAGYHTIVLVGEYKGKEMWSWRCPVRLYIDPIPASSTLPDEIFAPWDHESHRVVTAAGYGRHFRIGESRYASVFAFEGPDTAFPRLRSEEDTRQRLPYRELPAELILVVQVRQSTVLWSQPGDCRVQDLIAAGNEKIANYPLFRGPILIGFADKSVWRLSSNTPVSLIAKFATISGAKNGDRDKELGPYAKKIVIR